jgi:HAD superfamily hydrolase (TIGR01549 family)
LKIKAVTFDLWLTLIWDSKELEEYRRLRRLVNFYRFVNKVHRGRGIEQSSASRFTFNDVRLALEELGEEIKQDYERGEDVHPRDRARRLFKKLKVQVDEEEVYERAGVILSNSGYMKKFPHLNPEAKPTLKALKAKFPDLKIELISNAARSTKTYTRTLTGLGIAQYFDAFTISCEIGFLKPRKEIFEHALEQIDVAPGEALHVGDLFRADVVGATSCGMNACLYTGLWKKYSEYWKEKTAREKATKTSSIERNDKIVKPGITSTWPEMATESIPKDFKPPHGVIVKEISDLNEVVSLVADIRSRSL